MTQQLKRLIIIRLMFDVSRSTLTCCAIGGAKKNEVATQEIRFILTNVSRTFPPTFSSFGGARAYEVEVAIT